MIESNFRQEPIRSRKLLDSAKGQPCTFEFPGVCTHDASTVVSCHIHDEIFGAGQKADDQSSAHGCFACHAYLDQRLWLGVLSEAAVLRIVLRALQRTMRNRIRRGFMVIELDEPKPYAERKSRPRKAKADRQKIPAGKPLASGGKWPAGRKLTSRNNLRKPR